MEKSFLLGMIVALLLVALLASSGAVEYLHDNIEMGTSAVSGVATPTALSDGATKGYVDSVAALGCTWESVNTTYCNGADCYANMPTADKVCADKGYKYASTYTFAKSYPATPSMYGWLGNSWGSMSQLEDSGYGGGATSGLAISNGEYIVYALCCE